MTNFQGSGILPFQIDIVLMIAADKIRVDYHLGATSWL